MFQDNPVRVTGFVFMVVFLFAADFDCGKDVTAILDISKARHSLQKQRRINVDFPDWMIESLDKEASRLDVTRQSIIKIWLAERLEQLTAGK
ncbi:MAG: CopG family transcriptional regulator [Nitrosomonas sp.]|uniref:type II toxin-antitoxin system BrnA family antitoxin n=2 Tax=Nitrosomonas sp. TaxID=42353 RepID=UPI002731D73B|nr:CopG family transcriptional regulator [Nitrosomonas sp.]MDP3279706.1 CopG family transcriptional regulator [Nitrosomonas sp.]